MSRTYRHRHLPVLERGARKYVDATTSADSHAVAGAAWHPWVCSQSVGNPCKRWECTRGHRAMRRQTNRLLGGFHGPLSDPEGLWLDFYRAFPHSRIEIDPWSWD